MYTPSLGCALTVTLASTSDIQWIAHMLSSQTTNTHNPLNSSLSRRGQSHHQSHLIHCGSVQLDNDSIMDEVETNSNYDADSYLPGNANKFDGLSEHPHTSHPHQAEMQKWPQY